MVADAEAQVDLQVSKGGVDPTSAQFAKARLQIWGEPAGQLPQRGSEAAESRSLVRQLAPLCDRSCQASESFGSIRASTTTRRRTKSWSSGQGPPHRVDHRLTVPCSATQMAVASAKTSLLEETPASTHSRIPSTRSANPSPPTGGNSSNGNFGRRARTRARGARRERESDNGPGFSRPNAT